MTRDELEEQRDFLLTSLRDLDSERAAGDIDEDDYAALKDQYTARAAAVINRLDGEPGSAPFAARPPRVRSVVAGTAALLVALLAGILVTSAAGERLPGDQVSGSLVEGVTGKLARARQLIGAGKVSDAIKVYDEVLQGDPNQPEALAYRGWIVHLAGLSDRGLEYVDRAIAADPAYPDAHFFRGMILWKSKGDAAAAVTELQYFLDHDPPPEMVGLVEVNLERARAEAEGSDSPPTSSP